MGLKKTVEEKFNELIINSLLSETNIKTKIWKLKKLFEQHESSL